MNAVGNPEAQLLFSLLSGQKHGFVSPWFNHEPSFSAHNIIDNAVAAVPLLYINPDDVNSHAECLTHSRIGCFPGDCITFSSLGSCVKDYGSGSIAFFRRVCSAAEEKNASHWCYQVKASLQDGKLSSLCSPFLLDLTTGYNFEMPSSPSCESLPRHRESARFPRWRRCRWADCGWERLK